MGRKIDRPTGQIGGRKEAILQGFIAVMSVQVTSFLRGIFGKDGEGREEEVEIRERRID